MLAGMSGWLIGCASPSFFTIPSAASFMCGTVQPRELEAFRNGRAKAADSDNSPATEPNKLAREGRTKHNGTEVEWLKGAGAGKSTRRCVIRARPPLQYFFDAAKRHLCNAMV